MVLCHYDLLFKASAETTLKIAATPRHLGARIGFMSVLHTWGSALTHHPHVHMVVPGGGLSPDGSKWIACRPRYFLTVEVLSALFRRLFLEMLVAAHAAGHLQFFGDHARLADKAAFKAYLAPLRKIDWVVYAKEPFAGPEQVFHYLGRYTHRVGLSNQRLLGLTADGVHFRTRGEATATLSPDEFIHRFVQHVLPPGFVKIRHYGLMAPSNATTKLEVARRLLEAEHPDLPAVVGALAAVLLLANAAKRLTGTPAPGDDWRAHFERLTGIDVSGCPRCNVGRLTPHPLPPLWAKKPPDDTS